MNIKPYGSGYFGEWIEDEFGLPAYKYTCDQINDPKAITPVNEDWQSPTNHMHEIGNDRIVGVASNYGYVQLRQDEGSPKFLNDYNPQNGQFAGGFGYLVDGKNIITSHYSDKVESFERIFGVGYYRKKITDKGLKIDQTIFAPFGDDPLLISQVSVSNHRNEPVNLKWIEYWGTRTYQFSMKALYSATFAQSTGNEQRRLLSSRFNHKFSVIEGKTGILDKKEFKGYSESSINIWNLVKGFLSTDQGKALSSRPIEHPVEEAVLEDLNPPSTFLISLDDDFDGYKIGDSRFFGDGGVYNPDEIENSLDSNLGVSETSSGIFLERKFLLLPGETKTLYFSYGYIPEGFDLHDLISKYKSNLSEILPKSSEKWKSRRISLKTNDEDNSWIDRELTWHNYYLRGNLTFDSFFKEHILSQGHVYQYLIGFQGAARDPLQHALPFIYSEPSIVKNIIRYTLKEISSDDEIPYGITGSGMIMPAPFIPSDQELWLLWLASEYVLANRDIDFLNEKIPLYPIYGQNAEYSTVKEMLKRCYNHFVGFIGNGKHGLQRISNGDWNDTSIVGYIDQDKHEEVKKVGESVLNAAMASWVLSLYSKMLSYAGDNEFGIEVKKYADIQKDSVEKTWAGKWFKRAWLTEELGWIGEEYIWLEPQPWAILGGVTNQDQNQILLKEMNEKLRDPSKIGAMIRENVVDKIPGGPGMGTNAGIWPSINGTLIMALALIDHEAALEEWKKNSLAVHAASYPDSWVGIWSGPDTYNSELSEFPGLTVFIPPAKEGEEEVKKSTGTSTGVWWTDFPVMNMHPHAWPLYNIANLVGITFSVDGVNIANSIPKEEYSFTCPLVEFKKSKSGYTGKYSPKISGTWKISIELKVDERSSIKKLIVNGKDMPIKIIKNQIIFESSNSENEPLTWEIQK